MNWFGWFLIFHLFFCFSCRLFSGERKFLFWNCSFFFFVYLIREPFQGLVVALKIVWRDCIWVICDKIFQVLVFVINFFEVLINISFVVPVFWPFSQLSGKCCYSFWKLCINDVQIFIWVFVFWAFILLFFYCLVSLLYFLIKFLFNF